MSNINDSKRESFAVSGNTIAEQVAILEGGGGGGGTGTVTTISVVTANGISATITNETTTPALTFVLWAITPTTVRGLTITTTTGTFTLTAAKVFSVSNTLTLTGTDGSTLNIGAGGTLGSGAYATVTGSNTGDQTTVTGNAGTATALQTARTIGGTSFDGTANIGVALATTVTTNANLTGVVTSVGNATAIADAALSIAKTSGLQTALDAKAPLDSPALTGTPTAPTASAWTNTTQVATTAFVLANAGWGGWAEWFLLTYSGVL